MCWRFSWVYEQVSSTRTYITLRMRRGICSFGAREERFLSFVGPL